jgi:hypothetical protein
MTQISNPATFSIEANDCILKVANMLHRGLREIAIAGCTNGMIYGLRGAPERLGHLRDQWESWVTKDLARQIGFDAEFPYPAEAVYKFQSKLPGERGKHRQLCDIYKAHVGLGRFWIECKPVFQTVLLPYAFETAGRKYLRDYTGARCSNSPSKTLIATSIEQIWVDAVKLMCIGPEHGNHLGLLVLEFDRHGAEIENRDDYRAVQERLVKSGWKNVMRESWLDDVTIRAKNSFQEHVALWVRKTT